MATSMARLVAMLDVNKKPFDSKLKGATGSLQTFVSGALKIAAPLAAVFGGRAILDAANVQQKAERKLAGVLSATGNAAGLTQQQIQEYASELQALTGIGDEVTVNAAAMLGTFKEVKGDVFKEALARAQDLAATLDGDVKGATIQIGKALNDPIKGISALAESGVSFTEQQKEMVRNFMEQGDILSAQRIILDELKGEVGGVAEAMRDPVESVKGTLGDIAENLGFLILPSLHEALDTFNEWMGSAVPAQQTFKNLGEDIAWLFRNFDQSGKLAQVTLIDIALAALEHLPMIEKPIEDIAAVFMGTFAGVKAFFGAFVDNVIAGFQEIGNFAKAIGAGVSAAFESITSGDFSGAGKAFSDAFISELAAQEDVQGGGNPFEAFADAYKEASEDTKKFFEQGGGLSGVLQAEKDRLLEEIARDSEERDQQTQNITKSLVPGAAGGDGASLMESRGGESSGKVPVNRGVERGTEAAFEAIVRATTPDSRDPSVQRLDTLVELTRQTNQHLRKIEIKEESWAS